MYANLTTAVLLVWLRRCLYVGLVGLSNNVSLAQTFTPGGSCCNCGSTFNPQGHAYTYITGSVLGDGAGTCGYGGAGPSQAPYTVYSGATSTANQNLNFPWNGIQLNPTSFNVTYTGASSPTTYYVNPANQSQISTNPPFVSVVGTFTFTNTSGANNYYVMVAGAGNSIVDYGPLTLTNGQVYTWGFGGFASYSLYDTGGDSSPLTDDTQLYPVNAAESQTTNLVFIPNGPTTNIAPYVATGGSNQPVSIATMNSSNNAASISSAVNTGTSTLSTGLSGQTAAIVGAIQAGATNGNGAPWTNGITSQQFTTDMANLITTNMLGMTVTAMQNANVATNNYMTNIASADNISSNYSVSQESEVQAGITAGYSGYTNIIGSLVDSEGTAAVSNFDDTFYNASNSFLVMSIPVYTGTAVTSYWNVDMNFRHSSWYQDLAKVISVLFVFGTMWWFLQLVYCECEQAFVNWMSASQVSGNTDMSVSVLGNGVSSRAPAAAINAALIITAVMAGPLLLTAYLSLISSGDAGSYVSYLSHTPVGVMETAISNNVSTAHQPYFLYALKMMNDVVPLTYYTALVIEYLGWRFAKSTTLMLVYAVIKAASF